MNRCRDQSNYNLPLFPEQYLGEKLPRPHSIDLPSSIWDIRPEPVPYHRKKPCKTRRQADRKVLCIFEILFGEFYIMEFDYRYEWSVFVPLPRQRCRGLVLWQRPMLVCRWFEKVVSSQKSLFGYLTFNFNKLQGCTVSGYSCGSESFQRSG